MQKRLSRKDIRRKLFCQRTNKALFYTQSKEEVLKELDSSIEGLSAAQAQERLATYGHNELDEGEKRLLSKFIDQFKDLMIIILTAAALSVITEGMDGLTDAMIILAVVVLNAALVSTKKDKPKQLSKH